MQKRKALKIFFITIIILALIPYYFLEDKNDNLRMYFIDVGQGDGIMIKTPSDKVIIIDGGPFDDFCQKISSKLPFRKRNIDLLILTHAHQDHYLGLIKLIENYKINNIIYSGYDANFSDYIYLMNMIKQKNINLIKAKYGNEIDFDNNIKLKILHPIDSKEKEEDLNNTSVVVKLTYEKFEAIFTGDLTCKGEDEILKYEKNLKSEVLKVGHHGSKTSSCENFLQKVAPEIGIIQVGVDNKFNHPNKEALDRLKKYNVRLFRNDQLGDIFVSSNGNNYCINNICHKL